jgi:hypothetical protein
MNLRTSYLSLTILMICLFARTAAAATYYVSMCGSNAWAGTIIDGGGEGGHEDGHETLHRAADDGVVEGGAFVVDEVAVVVDEQDAVAHRDAEERDEADERGDPLLRVAHPTV